MYGRRNPLPDLFRLFMHRVLAAEFAEFRRLDLFLLDAFFLRTPARVRHALALAACELSKIR